MIVKAQKEKYGTMRILLTLLLVVMGLSVPFAQTTTIQERYSNGSSNRPGRLFVNGSIQASNIAFNGTGAWNNWQMSGAVTVTLVAGNNLLRLEGTTSSSLPLIDRMEISGGSSTPGNCNMPAGTPACVQNLSTAGSASQSSTGWSAPASRAIDGNTSGVWNNGSVTATNQSYQPWWQVDLGAVYSIDHINIWNRTDCCQNRLTNYYVFVSDTPFTSTNPNTTAGQSGVYSQYFSNYPDPSRNM